MASRKNKWRTAGRFQFRRETKRYSDGSPWGCDTLFVRIKGRACTSIEPFQWGAVRPGCTLCVSVGTYRAATPISAARMARQYLLARLEA